MMPPQPVLRSGESDHHQGHSTKALPYRHRDHTSRLEADCVLKAHRVWLDYTTEDSIVRAKQSSGPPNSPGGDRHHRHARRAYGVSTNLKAGRVNPEGCARPKEYIVKAANRKLSVGATSCETVQSGAAGLHGRIMPITVTLNIPEDLARILATGGRDLSRAALEAFAVEEYRAKRLSDTQFAVF